MEVNKNQYAVVREDTTIEYDGEVKVTCTKGYDVKGNIVSLATYRDYPDGERGYCVMCVEEDGYWNGGAYDPQIGYECQLERRKYVEGEIN